MQSNRTVVVIVDGGIGAVRGRFGGVLLSEKVLVGLNMRI